MYNSNIPADRELPSTKKLIKSTVLAAIGAGVLLVTVVMPAEYGIDPTGIGKLTGLQQMGEIRVSLAEEAAQDEATKLAPSAQAATEATKLEPVMAQETPVASTNNRSDEMKVTLAPNEGAEIKVTMSKGQKVNYEWSSTGKVNFDNHGDSKELNINYHGYGKGISQATDKGIIEAAFDGKHGWFWRNRTKEPVTITLATNGEYSSINRVD
jgi:hypothetical protein